MHEGTLLILFVAAQRAVELAWAEHNRRWLIAAGGIEFNRGHYPLIVVLHAAWLVTLLILGRGDVDPLFLAVFAALQVARLWIFLTLGQRWTTRIIVLPGSALITAGPYRFLRHPNYIVVMLEIAVVPLALGLTRTALVFSLLNGAVLWLRIRAENTALAWAGRLDAPLLPNGVQPLPMAD